MFLTQITNQKIQLASRLLLIELIFKIMRLNENSLEKTKLKT